MRPLLERAIAANPETAVLHAKLAFLHLDRYDYAAAAASLETALALDPHEVRVRFGLAGCYNMLRRPHDAIDLLAGEDEPDYERGQALMALGDLEAAEREFRAVLAANPDDAKACRKLCRLLRESNHIVEHLEICEELAARGVANPQLLYNWGWALALAGEPRRARRLLHEPDRVAETDLSVPAGFADIASFNEALAEEILTNPNRLTEFPVEDEANRGSKRVDNLFSGRRPELIALLLKALQEHAAAFSAPPREGFDPWARARPLAARLKAWGLLQRGKDYETWHIHTGGWLSGVYYVRVPRSVSGAGAGPGCIEFGPPSGLERAMPGVAPTRRHVPRDGMFLLAPSHYPHRTIPSGVDEDRISIAFDVVPDR